MDIYGRPINSAENTFYDNTVSNVLVADNVQEALDEINTTVATGVVGPASATDNAIARYDGTTGKLIQDSSVLIDDSDNMTGVTSIDSTSYKASGTSGVIARTGIGSGSSSYLISTTADSSYASWGVVDECIVVGSGAGLALTSGDANILVGTLAGNLINSGSSNTCVGDVAGALITTGLRNTALGAESNCLASGNDQLAIGYGATTTASNECAIGNASLTQVASDGFRDLDTISAVDLAIGGDKATAVNIGASDINTVVLGPMGIGSSNPKTCLHVLKSGTEIATVGTSTVAVVQRSSSSSSTCALSIIAGTVGNSYLNFGDTADENVGRLEYDHSANSMIFHTDQASRMTLSSTGSLDVTGGVDCVGYAINGTNGVIARTGIGGADNYIISGAADSAYTSWGGGALSNVVVGSGAKLMTTGDFNVVLGDGAGGAMTTSRWNTLIGTDAGSKLTTNENCVAIGDWALRLPTGSDNVAIGGNSMVGVVTTSTGSSNTGVGTSSMTAITSGSNNTCLGKSAGDTINSGGNNTCIGTASDCKSTGDNQIAIGYQATTAGSNTCVIGNSSITNIQPGADGTVILGDSGARFEEFYCSNATINTSDGSLKTIDPTFDYGLDFITKLKPIQYKWKDKGKRIHLGLDSNDIGDLIESQQVADFGGFIKPRPYMKSHYRTEQVKHKNGKLVDRKVFDREEEITPPLGIRYGEFIAPLIQAVKELKQQLEEVRASI